ncbi:unnamed protein product, partial [Thlaspi arvense]
MGTDTFKELINNIANKNMAYNSPISTESIAIFNIFHDPWKKRDGTAISVPVKRDVGMKKKNKYCLMLTKFLVPNGLKLPSNFNATKRQIMQTKKNDENANPPILENYPDDATINNKPSKTVEVISITKNTMGNDE